MSITFQPKGGGDHDKILMTQNVEEMTIQYGVAISFDSVFDTEKMRFFMGDQFLT